MRWFPVVVVLALAWATVMVATEGVISDRTQTGLLVLHTLSNRSGSEARDVTGSPPDWSASVARPKAHWVAALGAAVGPEEPAGLLFNSTCTAGPLCNVPPMLVDAPFGHLVSGGFLDNNRSFSVELWVRPQSASFTGNIVQAAYNTSLLSPSCDATTFRAWQLSQDNNHLVWTVTDDAPLSSVTCVVCTTSGAGSTYPGFAAGDLVHVVASYPPSGGYLSLAVNGVAVDCTQQAAAAVLAGAHNNLGVVSGLVFWGAEIDGTNNWLGRIYLSALYGLALDTAQIARNYEVGPYSLTPSPVSASVTLPEDTETFLRLNVSTHYPQWLTITVDALPVHGRLFAASGPSTKGAQITAVPHAFADTLDGFVWVAYSPDADYEGADAVAFSAANSEEASDPGAGVIALSVVGRNDPPTVTAQQPLLNATHGLWSAFAFNLTDVDSAELRVALHCGTCFLRIPSAQRALITTLHVGTGLGNDSALLFDAPASAARAILESGALALRPRLRAPDTLRVVATDTSGLGSNTGALAATVAPATVAAITGVPAELELGERVAAEVRLSIAPACGTTLTLTPALRTTGAHASTGAVVFDPPALVWDGTEGTQAVAKTLGIRGGTDLGAVSVVFTATGTAVSAGDFDADAWAAHPDSHLLTTVVPGRAHIASVSPRINTFPRSDWDATVTLTRAPQFGASLTLTPVPVAAAGAGHAVLSPVVFAPGETAAPLRVRGTTLYGNVTVTWVASGAAAGQFNVSQDTHWITEVRPVTDAVVSVTPVPRYLATGETSAAVTVTLSAPVQPRAVLSLDMAHGASSLGQVSWNGLPLLFDGDAPVAELSKTFTVTGTQFGEVTLTLVPGGSGAGQHDTSAFNDTLLTTVLPPAAATLCVPPTVFVGEQCLLRTYLPGPVTVDTALSIQDVPETIDFPSGTQMLMAAGDAVVSTPLQGVAVDPAPGTSFLITPAGGSTFSGGPVPVTGASKLEVVVQPMWVLAGQPSLPAILRLPYAPRPGTALTTTIAVDAEATDPAPASFTVTDPTFTLASETEDGVWGAVAGSAGTVPLVASTEGTAVLQYAAPDDLLRPVEVVETQTIMYISGIADDVVLGATEQVRIALTTPVPAGQTLVVRLRASGTGAVSFGSAARAASETSVHFGPGAQEQVLTVSGDTIGHAHLDASVDADATSALAYDLSFVGFDFRVVPECQGVVDCAFICNGPGVCPSSPSSSTDWLAVISIISGFALVCCLCLCLLWFMRNKKRSKEEIEASQAVEKETQKAKAKAKAKQGEGAKKKKKKKRKVSTDNISLGDLSISDDTDPAAAAVLGDDEDYYLATDGMRSFSSYYDSDPLDDPDRYMAQPKRY